MNPILNFIDAKITTLASDTGVRILYDGVPLPVTFKDDGTLKSAYFVTDNLMAVQFIDADGSSSCYLFKTTGKTISGNLIKYKSIWTAAGNRIFAVRDSGARDMLECAHTFIDYDIGRTAPEITIQKIESKKDKKQREKEEKEMARHSPRTPYSNESILAMLDKGLHHKSPENVRGHLNKYISLIKQGACTKDNPEFKKILECAYQIVPSYRVRISDLHLPKFVHSRGKMAHMRMRLEQDLIVIQEKPANNSDFVAIKEMVESFALDKRKTPREHVNRDVSDATPAVIRQNLSVLIDKIKKGSRDKNDPYFLGVLALAMKRVYSYSTPIPEIMRTSFAKTRLELEEALVAIGIKADDNDDLKAIQKRTLELKGIVHSGFTPKYAIDSKAAHMRLLKLEHKLAMTPGDRHLLSQVEQMRNIVMTLTGKAGTAHVQ